jgi:hypothetical protein
MIYLLLIALVFTPFGLWALYLIQDHWSDNTVLADLPDKDIP